MKQIHFILGLPRSGSTLLSGIRAQNPTIQTGMSSPVASLFNGRLEQTGAGDEFYSFFDDTKRKAICQALCIAYYLDSTVDLKIEFKQHKSILPPDLFQKYSEMAFGKDTAGSAASVAGPKGN